MGGGGFNIFSFSILNTTGTAVLALRVAGRYLYAVVWQYMRRNRPFAERMDANCNYALRIVSNYFPYSLIVTDMILFPSLWPSHAKGQHISGSTLVRVMTLSLTTPKYDLTLCWLIIKGVLWHSHGRNLKGSTHELTKRICSEIKILKCGISFLTSKILLQ